MKPTKISTGSRIACIALLTASAIWSARASDYPTTILSHGPIAYWRFEDTNASPPLNVITNRSTLGSIANGYVIGAVTKGAPGIIGTSAQFVNPNVLSDVGSCPAKIEVPWNASLNQLPPLSVEFWADPNTLSTDSTGYCPLSNFDPNGFGGGSRRGWLFYCAAGGRWQFRLGTTSGYAGIVTATSGNASVGVWQHIVATWDGATAHLYINGVLVGTASAPVANWSHNSDSFIRLGGTPLLGTDAFSSFDANYANSGNRGFDGFLQHVAIYTNVLPTNIIAAHYAAATTNNAGYVSQVMASSPVGYWPLNEPAYTVPTSGFPVATNSGSLGSSANGTNLFGALAAQPGPGYAGFGTKSNAVFFDGDNGGFLVNDTPGLHFTNSPNTITLAAWVKPIEQDFYRDIIEHGYDSSDDEVFLRISPNLAFSDPDWTGYGGGNYYEVGTASGVQGYEDAATAPIPPGDIGNWVFIVGTFDGTNWNIYRNGALVGTEVAQENGAVDVAGPWAVGSLSRDPGTFFSDPPAVVGQGNLFGGWIAEPAIFTNALSSDDVAALYAAAEVPPVITQAPANPGTVFTGASVSFSVWADGTPNLGYMWTSNGIPTGDTTTNYTINDIGAGTYTIAVIVTNAYGTNTPTVTFPVVNEPPFITVQPDPSEERYVGYPFSFSVTAGGTTPLTYYWKLGSTVVQAGPSSTYSGVASLANAGSYTVIVSNLTGINAVSSPGVLTVNPIPGNYPGQVISNGPVAFWRLDETSGTIAHDQIGGNDGTYFSATLGVSGYSIIDPDNLAAAFDGTNSYVGNISGTAINFAGSGHSFTLEAWVNAPEGQQDQATIIAKGIGNNGTTETEQFALDVAGGNYRFFTVGSARNTSTVYDADATEGPNGTWQHVVGVYDSSAGVLTIYVNGVAEGTESYSQPINSTVSPVSIGSKRTGNDPNYDGTFDGAIDNVAVYNYALSASQVLADYNSAYGTTLAPEILIEPVATTNYEGLPVTLSVTAIGSATLNYQWYQGTTPVGTNGSTYGVSSATPADAGNYHVQISNGVGMTNSVTNAIVVLPPPTTPPVIPDLVMHLTFDTNLTDVTGRGNSGTGEYSYIPGAVFVASNAVTTNLAPSLSSAGNPSFYYVSDGVIGSGLHFSTLATTNTGGATASIGTNDYYVSVGVRPDLQFGSNVDFTVSYWIRVPVGYGDGDEFGGGGDLPFFGDSVGSEGNPGFVFATAYGYGDASPSPPAATPSNVGCWGTTIYGSGGVGVRLYGNAFYGLINDGNWHSMINVISRSDNAIVTYLDGVVARYNKIAGTTLNSSGSIDVTNAAVIGQDPTGLYGETGSGDIDDLGVWRRALTPLEAGSIYIAGVSNKLSFTAPVTLTIVPTNSSKLAVIWPSGTLQSATNAVGTYTNVPGAVSPYVFSPNGVMEFFRVKQ